MKPRQIRSFLSIAEAPHFGRTAEMIHLNHSTLAVAVLEKASRNRGLGFSASDQSFVSSHFVQIT